MRYACSCIINTVYVANIFVTDCNEPYIVLLQEVEAICIVQYFAALVPLHDMCLRHLRHLVLTNGFILSGIFRW